MYKDRPQLETRSKIVATLGPASWNEPMLSDLLSAGVDVFRINCSHADHDSIRRQILAVRAASERIGKPTGVLVDLQGPKVRVGELPEPITLDKGDVLTVVMDAELQGHGKRVGTTYPEMARDVSAGDRVLFDDGALVGVVEEVRRGDVAEVDILIHAGGVLSSHKGINLPGVDMSVPSLTPKDLGDVAVAVDAGADFLALSFVRHPDDVRRLRDELYRLGAGDLPIIAKIEKPQAVERIEGILAVADGVMVARGDLGVEVSIEKVPVYQKRIIAAAHRAGVLCITATQMLDSMERNPRPTRAETTDVANAILDGTDAVMLSGETAVGRYPIEAVRMMDSIAREVESSRFFKPTPIKHLPHYPGTSGTVARAACYAATEQARTLVVFTWSGATARFASKARPMGPIFALTPRKKVADQLSLAWGVTPIVVPQVDSTDALISTGERALLDGGHVHHGEEMVILAGNGFKRETTNLMKIHNAGSTAT